MYIVFYHVGMKRDRVYMFVYYLKWLWSLERQHERSGKAFQLSNYIHAPPFHSKFWQVNEAGRKIFPGWKILEFWSLASKQARTCYSMSEDSYFSYFLPAEENNMCFWGIHRRKHFFWSTAGAVCLCLISRRSSHHMFSTLNFLSW